MHRRANWTARCLACNHDSGHSWPGCFALLHCYQSHSGEPEVQLVGVHRHPGADHRAAGAPITFWSFAVLLAGIEHPIVHSPGEFKRSSRSGGFECGGALGLGGRAGMWVTILADGSARCRTARRSNSCTRAPARLQLTLHCVQPRLRIRIRRFRHSVPALHRLSGRTRIRLVNGIPAVNTLVHLLGAGRARAAQRQQHKRSYLHVAPCSPPDPGRSRPSL